ncbi:S-adenosyl-L-methionine-dependent methyltransferase [Ascobolus immersus RN42]|uniref:S-adenosyl-L-methionine-dependent methyltransferase n=1 Tax=Ascobolus immersus RN42 TaxID=1160509 RepID=A0A3N4INQ2_ASCIM|nr:S-adenosyl-L-methionine-dependent methyltransferase [Ascobolus immersus RN42]
MADSPALLDTAEALHKHLTFLIAHLRKKKGSLPTASTEHDTQLHALKRPILHLTENLKYALNGPMETLATLSYQPFDKCALSVFIKFNFHHSLPCTSIHLATEHGLDPEFVDRTLAMLRTHAIVYNEPSTEPQGPVVWKAGYNCQPLFVEPLYEELALSCVDFPMVPGHILDYLERYPKGREKSTESVLWMLNGGKNLWQLCEEKPRLATRLLKGLQGFGASDETAHKIAEWIAKSVSDQASFPQQAGRLKIVDVGGGNGNASSKIATVLNERDDGLGGRVCFEVQDVHGETFEQALKDFIPEDQQESGQISFQKHDFFEPQPASTVPKQTAAFFLRRVLHDWTDQDCIRILRQLVPTLEENPNAAILINESIIPGVDRQVYRFEDREVRRLDWIMMLQLNSKERTMEQWVALLSATDVRLRVVEVLKESGQKNGVYLLWVLVVKLVK